MCPTSRLPALLIATTEGVRVFPVRFLITAGEPPCTVATTEFVVPRSIPMTGSLMGAALEGPPRLLQLFSGFGVLRLEQQRLLELLLRQLLHVRVREDDPQQDL